MQDSDLNPLMRGKKRIGFDTRNTALSQGTGVAAYAAVLMSTSRSMGFTPQYLTSRPVSSKLVRWAHAAMPDMDVRQDFSAPDVYRVAQVHFNIYRRPMRLHMHNPPDLMHWTYPLPVFLAGCKNIVTIHDLIPITHPQLSGIDGRRLHRMLRAILRQFDGIVTVSETVRREILDIFDIPAARVRTIYQAADLTMLDRQAQAVCPAGSFVVIGSVEARKNIRRIIAAHKLSQVATPLVIIGPDGEGAAAELEGMGTGVLRIPYVSRPVLLQTIQQARALLFPSLAEGFGLPIIEAFALGVPVMTSRGGATEEIAGDASFLVDPHDVNEMAETIRALAINDDLCAKLSANGLARSELFSLDACAGRLANYYDELLKF